MLKHAKVREWLMGTGGYSILDPQVFIDMGMEKKMVKRLTRVFANDPDLGKHSATRNDGEPGDVSGIDEFTAVDVVAGMVGAEPCHSFYGRGSNFRGTVSNILDKIGRE